MVDTPRVPTIPRDYLDAARRYGPSVDAIASQYTNPLTGRRLSGTALLLKLGSGESGFRHDAVSSADARSETQFTPGSRQTAIDKYGVDPWKNADQAVHAASLHLRGKINGSQGLEGYNPGGGQDYVRFILGQRVGAGGGRTPASSSTTPAPDDASTSGASGSGGQQLAALLSAAVAQDQPRVSMGLAAPAFAAAPVLPAGAQTVASQAPQRQAPGEALSAALTAIRGLQGPDAPAQTDNPGDAVPAGTPTAPVDTDATGTAEFEGKRVAAWIAPALEYARSKGWKGQVNSGYRSFQEQKRIYSSGVRPAAKPGTSNHEGSEYPRGAIDVSDAATLARILRRSPYGRKLQWAGAKDPVHFSHPHAGSY